MMSSQQAMTPFQSASLYVGDLHPEVTESLLFELFNRVGPVASIRVCRDSVTRRSLGYAYVNFHNVQDAERALDTMNFSDIKGRPCRIMWSQRDPSLRRSGVGNVFVRNLAASVDNKGLYDTFSVFGNILSCKVATDENGNSKGYGYVHFETAEAAQDAIQKFNGTVIDDQEVHVGSFVRRQDRAGQNDWTNLYVKQFPTTWDEAKIKEMFGAFGTIANVAISRDTEGKSKGFGFVNYADHTGADAAVKALNGKNIEDASGNFELYVSRAQKKVERAREIKQRLDALNQERISKYQGMNLYVKNIADGVTDEAFREAFAPYGTITSARIMRENNENKASKGFGFVCYSTVEEANRAATEMNGKVIGGKPLVVTMHQRREQRRAQLASSYAPQNMRYPQGGMPPNVPMAPYMGMYMQGGQQGGFPGPRGAPMQGGPFPYPGGMPGRGAPVPGRGAPYGGPRPGFYPPGPYGAPVPGQAGQGGPRGRPAGQQGPYGGPGQAPMGGQGGRRPQGQPGMGAPGRGMPPMGGPQMGRGPPMGGYPQPGNVPQRGNVKFTNQVRNQNGQLGGMQPGMMGPGGMAPQVMPMPGQQMNKPEFNDALLASADPLTQKNMIGEHLYPLIYQHQPEQAGKITGMLLEMDNGELLNLIESPDALMAKIDEALAVLRNHKSEE